MRARLILPKTLPNLEPYKHLPLFYLAGPILGGGDWQYKMAKMIEELNSDCLIANPRRYTPDHPLYSHYLVATGNIFERQTDWERYFMHLAGSAWPKGCLIFWLAAEDAQCPRDDGNAYSIDTQGELGEWRGQMMWRRCLRVAVGVERCFPRLDKIKRDFENALPDFPIYNSMEAVVRRAIHFAHPSLPTMR